MNDATSAMHCLACLKIFGRALNAQPLLIDFGCNSNLGDSNFESLLGYQPPHATVAGRMGLGSPVGHKGSSESLRKSLEILLRRERLEGVRLHDVRQRLKDGLVQVGFLGIFLQWKKRKWFLSYVTSLGDYLAG